MNTEILKKAGIDYDNGVRRFLGDKNLYESILKDFFTDEVFAQAERAFADKDYAKLFMCAHTIKGMAGNMDVTPLYRSAIILSDLLRSNNAPDESKVEKEYREFSVICEEIAQSIKKASDNTDEN